VNVDEGNDDDDIIDDDDNDDACEDDDKDDAGEDDDNDDAKSSEFEVAARGDIGKRTVVARSTQVKSKTFDQGLFLLSVLSLEEDGTAFAFSLETVVAAAAVDLDAWVACSGMTDILLLNLLLLLSMGLLVVRLLFWFLKVAVSMVACSGMTDILLLNLLLLLSMGLLVVRLLFWFLKVAVSMDCCCDGSEEDLAMVEDRSENALGCCATFPAFWLISMGRLLLWSLLLLL